MKQILVFLFLFCLGSSGYALEKGQAQKPTTNQLSSYQAKDFSHLIGMKGFSDSLLETHFTLYRGYVTNVNLLLALLKGYRSGDGEGSYPYQAIKRRFGWEFDGMRLHELYFENLGGKGDAGLSLSLKNAIERAFGSLGSWKKDFIATGMMRGIGWAILYEDPAHEGRLFNTWINEHDVGHLAGGKILLVMDVWEHAYMPQYGLGRRAYIDAFFENIDWPVVEKRMN